MADSAFFAPDVQQQQIDQRRAMAQALLEQGQQNNGQTQQIGGVAIRNSPIAGLANMLGSYLGARGLKESNQQQSNLSNQRQQAMVQALQSGFGQMKSDPNSAMATLASNPDTARYAQALAPEMYKPQASTLPNDIKEQQYMGIDTRTPEGRAQWQEFKKGQSNTNQPGELFGNTYRTQDAEGNIHLYQLSKMGQPIEIKTPGGQKIAAETPWDKRSADTQAAIDTESGKTNAKVVAERDQGFVDTGVKSFDGMKDIQRMQELNAEMMHGGVASAITKAGDLFGKTPADEGEFRTLSRQLVLSNIKALGTGNSITDTDRQFIEKMMPYLGQGGEVNQRILDRLATINNRAIARGKEAAKRTNQNWDELTGSPSTIPAAQPAATPAANTATPTAFVFNPKTGKLEPK